MLKQGVLAFRYEGEPTESGMTALAGLPVYLELAIVSGLTDSIQRHLGDRSEQKGTWLSFSGYSRVIRTEGTSGDGSSATLSHSELGRETV